MPAKFQDYYATLGVSREATPEEIKKAFRKLARQYHPDTATDKKAAEEKFKEINEAHEVLSDPEKRRKYDQLGANWNQTGGFEPPPGWGGGQWSSAGPGAGAAGREFHFGGTGFSDFFEGLFGRRGRAEAPSQRGPQGPRDSRAKLAVPLQAVHDGGSVRVNVNGRQLDVRVPTGVKPGQVMFEVTGVDEVTAKRALARVAHKMPVPCRFVHRRHAVA